MFWDGILHLLAHNGCAKDKRSKKMEIRKITEGFVVQYWDTETKSFTGQDFRAANASDYEADGRVLSDIKVIESVGYLPFDMVQPVKEVVKPQSVFPAKVVGICLLLGCFMFGVAAVQAHEKVDKSTTEHHKHHHKK
jgi:hypothetical protein